ncbi:HD domain-containing protein [Sphingomonas sp. LY160]|uniref:HD domain-containing protein n=1 Tax=Sphingomonas sp. LY160 TaxID=3095342 RepID=UPI002ADEAB90|nr:HD domain-containing protein [Sphingomonas sp. LY160]MEA1071767.1 HD domain-containing protein [Sphingomonas sp. LY160]
MSVRKMTPTELLGGHALISSANPALVRNFRKLKAAKARDFAVAAHGNQLYGDRPYVEHLEAVVRVLEEFDFFGDCSTAGWLHDVIEDTAITLADLGTAFGDRVAKLVFAVSGGGDRATHVASIYEKITAYPDAAPLKLADRIANIEACERGDKHAGRYAREHPAFSRLIEPLVPAAMWQRYTHALSQKQSDL